MSLVRPLITFALAALLAAATIATFAHAADSTPGLGKELKIMLKDSGEPNLGISYSYDSDFSWLITFQTTLTAQDIEQLPKSVSWSVYDLDSNTHNEWKTTVRDSVFLGQFELKGRDFLTQFLPRQKRMAIIFAADPNQAPLYYLPLGTLCNDYPTAVRDMTNPANKACVVSPQDIPDLQTECDNLAKNLLQNVKDGYMSCDTAQLYYKDRECGTLDCKPN